MAYVQVVNGGKGFITHQDQTKLSFQGGVQNLWRVSGSGADIAGVAQIQAQSQRKSLGLG